MTSQGPAGAHADAGISVYTHSLCRVARAGHGEWRGLLSSQATLTTVILHFLTGGPLPTWRLPPEHFLPSPCLANSPSPPGLSLDLVFSGGTFPSWCRPHLWAPTPSPPSPACTAWSSLFIHVPLPLALSSGRAGAVSVLSTRESQEQTRWPGMREHVHSGLGKSAA